MVVSETIKAIAQLAWPIVVAIVALSYKSEFLALLPPTLRRKFKIELPGGIKVEMGAAEQQQKTANLTIVNSDSGTIELKEIPGLERTAAIERIERDLHMKLKDVSTNQVDVLVRNLAQARLEAAFGFIYAGIFGSQIAGLIELGARRKVPTDEAHKFYLEIEKKYPEIYEGYGFPGWLNFLKHHGLINQVGDDIVITDIGDDFLKWLQATKLSPNKTW